MKLNPLFLSAAIDSASNEQYPAHSAPDCAVEAFDNSSPAAASGTKRRSSDSVSQTSPKSHAPCDPTSSNLQHIHWHTHPFSKPWSIDAAEPLDKRLGRCGGRSDLGLGACSSRRQRQTLCGVAPTRRATSLGPIPCFRRSRARPRRLANCWDVPNGLMPLLLHKSGQLNIA